MYPLDTDNPPRGGLRNPPGGRPPMPEGAQKVKINITLDQDILEWIDEHGTNRSRFINKLLRQAVDKAAKDATLA